MKKIQLVDAVNEQILKSVEDTKENIKGQTHRLERILKQRIKEEFSIIDIENLEEIFNIVFTSGVLDEIDSLFRYYQETEMEFYTKNLNTVKLIFDTVKVRRTQIIYLNNSIKKINEKEILIDDIFTESFRNKYKDIEDLRVINHLSINQMFDRLVGKLGRNPRLSIGDIENMHTLVKHYYELYKDGVLNTIKSFLEDNQALAVAKIEAEMDKRETINGKTSTIVKLERAITNNSINVMYESLINIVDLNKKKTKNELKTSASTVVELIFRLLPEEYQEQKGLLDVIVDTSINERLRKLVDIETEKLQNTLKSQNEDRIGNELYEEKRYKIIKDYECDFSSVEEAYKVVLHEIIITYDIPEEERLIKRMMLGLLGECNSTKNVLEKMIDNIKRENARKLEAVCANMKQLSEEISKENNKVKVKD